MSDSVWPHRPQPTRLPHPWDSPGKNTGVGCHFLLQCMKVKSESEVAQSCPTLSDPMDRSPPGSSAHGIFQARGLEWGAIVKNPVEVRELKFVKSLIQHRCGLCQKSPTGVLLPGSREGWLDSSRVGVSLSRSSRRVKAQVLENTDYQSQQLSSELWLGLEVTPRRLLHYKGPWSTPGAPNDSTSFLFLFQECSQLYSLPGVLVGEVPLRDFPLFCCTDLHRLPFSQDFVRKVQLPGLLM